MVHCRVELITHGKFFSGVFVEIIPRRPVVMNNWLKKFFQ